MCIRDRGYSVRKVEEIVKALSSGETVDSGGKKIKPKVASGLEVAHNNQIVHRDIKPQNIIISREGKVKGYTWVAYTSL